MPLTINDCRKISAIQEEFNAIFPYLRLEFFSKPNKSSGIFNRKQPHESGSTLKECRTIQNNTKIVITPDMTVKRLEKKFRDICGLNVRVLRKSGKCWIGTTVTERWTLEKQNGQGMVLNKLTNFSKDLVRRAMG
ncbi:MAG: hypothetical protein IT235_09115 [Bacteroidia bacterium]|nr:hypothetical protein [Bacteroidia bacterium]